MERRVLVIEGNVGVVAGVGKGLGERILEKNAGNDFSAKNRCLWQRCLCQEEWDFVKEVLRVGEFEGLRRIPGFMNLY